MTIRLYVSYRLLNGAVIALSKNQSHYVVNVMRARKYDSIIIFNGLDGEWTAEIDDCSLSSTRIIIKNILRVQCDTGKLMLCFCPVKGPALNNIIRQATEMGVTTIIPVISQFTIVRKVNIEKFKVWAIEASEQCYRLDVPEILPAINLFDLNNLQSSNRCFVCCDTTAQNFLHNDKLENVECCAIIGPEGGFSENELQYMKNFCYSISLGPRILRSDTAVICALNYILNLRH